MPDWADLPRGECVVTYLATGTATALSATAGHVTIAGPLRVERADPRVFISGALVRYWLGGTSPLLPALVVIEAVNSKVIYRISRYRRALDVYEAEFPD